MLRDFNDHLRLLGRHLEWDYHGPVYVYLIGQGEIISKISSVSSLYPPQESILGPEYLESSIYEIWGSSEGKSRQYYLEW